MIQSLIHRILARRHYWRVASFSEIAELYTSRLLFTFAINIVNLFAAVWLYKLGYSVLYITVFYAATYAFRTVFSFIAAWYVSYFGPKHGVLIAGLLRIPSLIAFMFVPEYGLIAIILFGVFQQMSSSIYDISYWTDFSKVKSIIHPGKEIGTMLIFEKIARIISPVVGGVLATAASPQATILVAAVLFVASAIPLLRSVEPIPTRSRMKFKGFPWRYATPSLISQSATGFDFVTSGLVWSLLLTVVIFGTYGDGAYAAIGGLASIGVLTSVVTAWTFGKLVDKHQGDTLLSFGTIANAIIHVFRALISTPVSAVMVSIANETATSAYSIPFTRVIFDVADGTGFRVTYIMLVEMMLSIGAFLACIVFAICVLVLGDVGGIKAMFIVAAAYEFLLLVSRRQAK
jgi:MFS family permease